MITAVNVYSGGGLTPAIDGADAKTTSVNLGASRLILQGTAIGQVTGTGSAIAEVQSLIATGASAGTFNILFDGFLTAAIAYNATVAQVQAALEALSNVGTGGIVVSGGPLPNVAVSLTFSGELAGLAQQLLTTLSSLTGGTAVITRTTAGKPASGYWDAYSATAAGSFAGLATAKMLLKYDSRVDSRGRIFPAQDLGSDNNTFLRSMPAYFAGTFRTSDLVGLDATAVTQLGRLINGDATMLTDTKTLLRIG